MLSTPYHDALAWINAAPGTGSATNLARLTLSFYNSNCAFAFSECVSNLDSERTGIAVRMAVYYAQNGEDEDLRNVGKILADQFPRMWETGVVMTDARNALRRKWEREDDAAYALENPGE